jgi:hypothetical protein
VVRPPRTATYSTLWASVPLTGGGVTDSRDEDARSGHGAGSGCICVWWRFGLRRVGSVAGRGCRPQGDYDGGSGYDNSAPYDGRSGYDNSAPYDGRSGYDNSAPYDGGSGYDHSTFGG